MHLQTSQLYDPTTRQEGLDGHSEHPTLTRLLKMHASTIDKCHKPFQTPSSCCILSIVLERLATEFWTQHTSNMVSLASLRSGQLLKNL
ncbi:hypothetical protein EDB19DRAFT_2043646 [Suillus lakei]|nr:hypothetical protein EDB19DRAFT_2043646 [Suillus lakei]